MNSLKQKIIAEGKIVSDTILKVDSFLNHQLDPFFIKEIGEEFARRFKGETITKILTVEASGIAFGLMAGLYLKVPVVFAKKKQASTLDHRFFSSTIYSFTKQESVEIFVSKNYLSSSDRVLVIDDFLARGEALRGLCKIVKQSGAQLVGCGIVIEKSFQDGGQRLRNEGVRIESLARVAGMQGGRITFID